MPRTKNGILCGAGAVLLWSTSSSCIVFGAQKVGVWQMLAVSCSIGGLAQLAHCFHQGIPPRRILLLPPKLLLTVLLGFVMYMLLYAAALAAAPGSQKLGVNLAQYLWPSLIVLFAVFVVPGTTMTAKLFLALLLALSGVLMANFNGLRQILAGESQASPVPYVLAVAAAIAWAAYSVLLARWRSWAHPYPTAPVGLLLIAAIAWALCLATGSWTPMDSAAWISLAFMGLGPQGAGYLLWELAVHRAPASTLGLLASATPVLSTVWLLVLYRFLESETGPPNYTLLLLAALTISLAVVLGTPSKAPQTPAHPQT